MVANLMDMPFWLGLVISAAAVILVGAVLAFVTALLGIPHIPESVYVVVLPLLLVAAAYWLMRGERSIRRRQFEMASSRYRLGHMTPYEFQMAVGELFRLQGYSVTENKRMDDEDGGVDLDIFKDGERRVVQVKHRGSVGVKDIRELWGIVADEHVAGAVFVTSGDYTLRAREFAKGKPFELVNGNEFLTLRKELAPTASAAALDFDPMLSEGFAKYLESVKTPLCDQCGKPMALKTRLSGTAIVYQFWACPVADHRTQSFIRYEGDA